MDDLPCLDIMALAYVKKSDDEGIELAAFSAEREKRGEAGE